MNIIDRAYLLFAHEARDWFDDDIRLVPVGTGGNAPDPDVIPPSAIERVEVVLGIRGM